MLTDLARLVVPVACPGCRLPDVRWCAPCAAAVLGRPRRVEQHAGRLDLLDGVAPLPTWAATAYVAGVRDVVVAWKDRGRVDLDPLLVAAVQGAARSAAPLLREAVRAPVRAPDRGPARGPAQGSARGPGDGPVVRGSVVVVPVPSTGAAARRRGRDPVRVLARGVAGGLVAAGVRAEVGAMLRRRGAARDQVGLGARARGRNLDAAIAVRRRCLEAAGRRRAVVLVDDVLTTGATLAAAERALVRAGADVLGAVVLAATPPPGTPHEIFATGAAPAVHRADTFGLG
ncbi:ComF family protein [Isoptericola jiangsuensis]|uniref:ComF family protein n=1 Tax=Isoptericola jiangsuensis TaxID=548579 RepID=UPI003AAEC347